MSSKLARVGILSDTHGAIDERVARVIASCDIAVHAGDIGDASVLKSLHDLGVEVFAVRGNNDTAARWPENDLKVLDTLPHEVLVGLPGGQLLVVHGHEIARPGIRHDRLRRSYPDARAIVYGHSHRLVCDELTTPWVMNPGAGGHNRTFGGPSCLVLTAGSVRWQVKEYRFEFIPARKRA